MKRSLPRLLTSFALLCGAPVAAQSVFINEIHYDNEGTDVEEGVEVAGPAGTDLSGYDLVFYNGTTGALVSSAHTLALSGTLANAGSGWGFAWFPKSGIENGSPDGVALLRRATSEVVQFLSWEGPMTATAGVAAGRTSTNLPVSEATTSPLGSSLQLRGTGQAYADFTWAGPVPATRGQANFGQSFAPVEPPPPIPVFSGLLRVASFNVLNGVGTPGSAEYLAVLQIIRRLQPEVIAFTEIDTAANLSDLKALLAQAGFPTSASHLAFEGTAFTGQSYAAGDFGSVAQAIAIASRYPILETVQIGRGDPTRREMSRFPVYVRLDVPTVPAAADPSVVTVHLKASGMDADRFRRAVELFRVRQFLEGRGEIGTQRNIVVAGDFNEQDEPGQPASYSTALPNFGAGAVFSDGSALPATFLLGSDIAGANAITLPYNLFPLSGLAPIGLAATPTRQTDGATATYNFAGNARLDYIFMPQHLTAAGLVRGEIYNSRLENAFDGLPKTGAVPGAAASFTGSDHHCIYADFPLTQQPKLQLSLSQSQLREEAGRQAVVATVVLPQPAVGPFQVQLGPWQLGPVNPGSYTLSIPAGQTTASATFWLEPNASVASHREIAFQATASGHFPSLAKVAWKNWEAGGQLLVTQYVENAGTGTSPKAVEFLNASGVPIFFKESPLTILRYSNGSYLSEQEASLQTGNLGIGKTLVVGDSLTGDYLVGQGLILPDPVFSPATAPAGHLFYDLEGDVRFLKDVFTFNGDDALEILLNHTRQDVFGKIGMDPGTAWNGGTVATAGQNISLLTHLGTGTSGFSDPSSRFFTVSSTDALTGFGLAPVLVDDYLAWATAMGLSGLAAAPLADADGDGTTNLMEYALPEGPPTWLAGNNPGSSLRLQLVRRTLRPGLRYAWQASGDLTLWQEQNLVVETVTPLPPNYEQLVMPVSRLQTRRFWRLLVSRDW